jgi:hypothetical protein
MMDQNFENESRNLSGAAAGTGVEVTEKHVGDGKLSTSTEVVSDHLICSLKSELRKEMETQNQFLQQQLDEIKSLILSTRDLHREHGHCAASERRGND